MNKELFNEFIAFAKAEYGLTVTVVESDTPDTFEKIFRISTILKKRMNNMTKEELIKLIEKELACHEKFMRSDECDDDSACEGCPYYQNYSKKELLEWSFKLLKGIC